MLPLDTAATFFMASILLALAPGPDNIFVLTQAALRGKIAGLAVTLGLCTGLIVHTTAVAVGVAAIFRTSAVAFTVLKSLGACYLLRCVCSLLCIFPHSDFKGFNGRNRLLSPFFMAFPVLTPDDTY